MNKSSSAVVKSTIADSQVATDNLSFPGRLRAAADKKGWKQRQLATESGLSAQAISEYWRGKKAPSADNLFVLADALSVPAEFLIRGTRAGSPVTLADASGIDIVMVPEFDLSALTESSKGEPVSENPMRRDWLQRTFGEWRDLWITALPVEYESLGLAEGHPVLALDTSVETLIERGLYIWTAGRGFVVARFSYLREDSALAAGDRLGDYYVGPSRIGTEDGQLLPVARILGQPVSKI